MKRVMKCRLPEQDEAGSMWDAITSPRPGRMKGFRNKRVLERRFPGRDDRGVVDTRPGERTHFEDG